MKPIAIYIEAGKNKVIAGALDWPGWCLPGRNEDEAVQKLLDYAPRYAALLKGSGLAFSPPEDAAGMQVVERIEGNATTDFGAPDMPTSADREPFDAAACKRALAILDAGWKGLKQAARAAEGKTLTKGPRGGGRELEAILRHVVDSQHGYLNRIGWKSAPGVDQDLAAALDDTQKAVRAALERVVKEGLPEQGPRGGKIWLPGYFVRRSAWHIIEHVWEIENRSAGG